jgi:FSR family fosmidomycin resistance protein-like MFS transporter
MAIFVSAGTVGFSLGPTYFSAIAGRWGLSGTWLAAMPGIVVSALLLALLPHAEPAGGREQKRLDWRPLRDAWKPLTILYLLVFLRSVVQITFAQFLPLYLHVERGFAFSTANHTLSLYLFGGALGGFLGGHLADRFGGRTVIQLSMIGSVPFLVLFFLAPGALSLFGLFLGGLMLLFTIPVNVVMAQELAPGQSGTVSALMMGFGWGMAGLIFIPITGWAFDHFPMRDVLLSLTAAPAIGFLLALKLPRSGSP